MSIDYERMHRHWNQYGWVTLDGLIPDAIVRNLSAWVDWVSTQPAATGEERQHYYEQTARGVVLCRTERYLADHSEVGELIARGPVVDAASFLLDEQAVLYKEKVNYKHAGGAGFAPHQDATAYKYVNHHITCLIAVDPMTTENGCLEIARGDYQHLLPDNGDGCLPETVSSELEFEPVLMAPGEVLYFSSFVPHRSGENRTSDCRRALYLTYNGISEGDQRAAYYADRDRQLAQTSRSRLSRISTIGHFQGQMPDADLTS